MQAKSRILVFLVAILSAVALTACGGGTTGKTWFNTPSVPLKMGADGSLSLWGLPVGPPNGQIAAQVAQLQGAGVEQLEVRPGYDGIFLYSNGEPLPYVEWDQESIGTLQGVLNNLPAEMTNGQDLSQVAQALDGLRTIGIGAKVNVPPAGGGAPQTFAPWTGETLFTDSDAAPENSMTVGSLAFSPDGQATIEGTPLSNLGVGGVALPAGVIAALTATGAEKLGLKSTANGLDLSLGDKKLPSIAFNGGSLDSVLNVAGPFIGDQAMLDTIKSAVPTLQSTELDLQVGLTGEPAVATDLGEIPLAINADGTLSAMGFPTGQPVLDENMLGQLQAAGISQLDVNLNSGSGIQLGANGASLPSLSWTGDSFDKIVNGVVKPMLGDSAGSLDSGLAIFDSISGENGFATSLTIPGADGSSPEMMAANLGSFAAPDPNAPTGTIRMVANYADGQLTDISGTDMSAFADMAALPPQLADIMGQLGASALQIKSETNKLNIMADGENLMALDYDTASLNSLLDLAGPFLGDTPLADPNMMAFVKNTIVPSLPGSDLDITINVE